MLSICGAKNDIKSGVLQEKFKGVAILIKCRAQNVMEIYCLDLDKFNLTRWRACTLGKVWIAATNPSLFLVRYSSLHFQLDELISISIFCDRFESKSVPFNSENG